MAILFTDSFQYTTLLTKYDTTGSYQAVASASPRFTGDRYLNFTDGAGYVTKILGGAQPQTIMLQFGLYWTYANAQNCLCAFYANGGQKFNLRINSAYQLQLYRWTTHVQTSTLTIPSAAWNQIELKAYIHGSAGTLLVKCNGVTIFNLTSQNLNYDGGNLYADQFALSGPSMSGGQNTFRISDVIVMDTTGSYCNDLLGARRVQPCLPTGAGYYSQWSPSAGSNWQNVEEVPPTDDTDYNSTSDVDEIDTFEVPDVANTNATIDAVVLQLYGKSTDAGFSRVKGICRSNSVDGLSDTEVVLTNSYKYGQSPIYLDPNTSAPFTVSGFNAAEFGYKRTA